MSDHTIMLNRLEMQWLHRQVVSARDKLEGKLKNGPAAELHNIQKDLDFFSKIALEMNDRINNGDAEKLKILNLRTELEEAITLCEEPEAIEEAKKRLDNLPKEEQYRVIFGKDQLKFTIKMLDKDIMWLYGKSIPNYEKRDDYTDPVMTKSYYINKAKKAKGILSNLKARLMEVM